MMVSLSLAHGLDCGTERKAIQRDFDLTSALADVKQMEPTYELDVLRCEMSNCYKQPLLRPKLFYVGRPLAPTQTQARSRESTQSRIASKSMRSEHRAFVSGCLVLQVRKKAANARRPEPARAASICQDLYRPRGYL